MTRTHSLTAIAVLWLLGVALRLPILAVPPVLTTVQADLSMSGTEVGILSGLPVIVFAVAALPGSLLIARIGAVSALVAGLLVGALGCALRAGVPNVEALYGATAVLGVGIAVMQPALPVAVRQWLPDRIGFGTAVFINGLIVGEFVPVMTMTPLVLPMLDGSWRWGLAVWSVPLVAIAALTVALAPRLARGQPVVADERPVWWPDWSSGLIWRMAFILGGPNSAYFGANAFLPGHLEAAGRSDLIPAALTALNVGQVPASLLLLVVAGRLERRSWPFVGFGLSILVCIIGMALTANVWSIVFAAGVGFGAGGALALSLALPSLLMPPGDVARTSAAMFAVGYTEAMIMSVLGGIAWDATGSTGAAFTPVMFGLVPLIVLAPTLWSRGVRSVG
jgi:CP family cyanate transporter-like MFS transporter